MAEVLGIVTSALTIGECAIRLSTDLFIVIRTFKNAPEEIAAIAEEMLSLSDSFQSLADIIKNHHTLCKPELFRNTEKILARYRQVDAELRKLIDTPQSLARLKWCIKKPKAKSLLKKVESIKMLLILELNLIRVAREELTQSHSDEEAAVKAQSSSKSNRFRKIVESAVQANRQIVESAQRDDPDNSAWRSRQIGRELNVWKESSSDTATWLYHLVFSPQIPDFPPPSAAAQHQQYQGPVSDQQTEQIVDFPCSHRRPSTPSDSEETEKAMIVWNRQTEPSLVVDRLLYAWTTLTTEQINQTSAQDGEEVRVEEFLRMVQEAKEEEAREEEDTESSNYDQEEDRSEFFDDNLKTFTDLNPPPPMSSMPTLVETKESGRHEYSADARELEFKNSKKYGKTSRPKPRTANSAPVLSSFPRKVRWEEDTMSQKQNPFLSDYKTPRPSMHSSAPERPRKAASHVSQVYTIDSHADLPDTSYVTEPTSGSMPYPRQNIGRGYVDPRSSASVYNFPPASAWSPASVYDFPPASGVPPSPSPASAYPYAYPYPPPPPPPPASPPPPPPPPAVPTSSSKEDAIISALEKLLAGRERKDPQPESEDPHLSKIMQLLVAQQEDHAKAEKAEAEAAMELQLKQISAVRDRHEGTIKRLETLILQQREDRIKAEADLKMENSFLTEKLATQAEEVKAAAAQVEKIRKEAEVRAEERNKAEPQTMRRTCIRDGNRSIEVAEYASDRLQPLTNVPTTPFQFFEEETFGLGLNPKLYNSGRCYDGSMGSADSWTSRTSPTNPTQGLQKMILFPSKIDRTSSNTLKLQASLTASGVQAVFDETNSTSLDTTMRSLRANESRSTIFWEPPIRPLGSDLLFTMKRAGWRPLYMRRSDAGQTFFLGDQPIHSYIFRPDYQPHFAELPNSPAKHVVVISRGLVEEDAIEELGFEFKYNNTGAFMLDGSLTTEDIECLVERSFSIRETGLRKSQRQLQRRHASDSFAIEASTKKTRALSVKPSSPRYAASVSSSCSETKTDHGIAAKASHPLDAHSYRVPDSDDDSDRGTPSLRSNSISTPSSSVTSKSSMSKSSNPYHEHMLNAKRNFEFGGSIHGST